jgi:hypothetical protein
MKYDFDNNKVGIEILNEIFSHGITIEDLYKNFNGVSPVEVQIKKEFETSKSKFIFFASFVMTSYNYLVSTLSITKSFDAFTIIDSEGLVSAEDTIICGIAAHITNGYISEAKVAAEDDSLDMLYFENKPMGEVANLVKIVRPDTHEVRLFLEQVKLLLEDEIIYKDEVRVVKNSVRKAVRATIPIKRNNGIFS